MRLFGRMAPDFIFANNTASDPPGREPLGSTERSGAQSIRLLQSSTTNDLDHFSDDRLGPGFHILVAILSTLSFARASARFPVALHRPYHQDFFAFSPSSTTRRMAFRAARVVFLDRGPGVDHGNGFIPRARTDLQALTRSRSTASFSGTIFSCDFHTRPRARYI